MVMIMLMVMTIDGYDDDGYDDAYGDYDDDW